MKILLLALLSVSPDPALPISYAASGVHAAALSGTPTTSALNMEESHPTRQLSLTLAVTPGSTTVIVVKCYESQDALHYDRIAPCDSSGACSPDTRTYTIADYTADTGVVYIASRWIVTKKYANCSAYGAGSGTVTITGVRS